jgi:peptide/nickel transport system substrate-binding protein
MKKAFLVIASLVMCIILLAGCTTGPTTSAPTTTGPTTSGPTTSAPTTSAPTSAAVVRSILGCPQGDPDLSLTPQYGGVLKIITSSGPANMGVPWLGSRPTDSRFQRFAVESLIGLGPNGEPQPQLAESWNADPVNKTLTLNLRKGVMFQDNTPFNADAVKYNLQKQIDNKKTELMSIKSMDVIDDSHLKITYTKWDALTISYLASNVAGRIVSPTTAKQYIDAGKESDLQRYPVGTGPFKLAEFKTNVSAKFVKFDGYWQKGLPYLDEIDISIVADPVVALTSFTKGEADVLDLSSTKDAKALQAQGYNVSQMTNNVFGICGDSKNASSPWANINIRQAVAYAIDRETIVKNVYDGLYPIALQLAIPGRTAYNPSILGYPYNPDKAKELLAPLGITPATPLITKFVYENKPQDTDLWTVVQQYLARVGINLILTPIPGADFRTFTANPWTNQWVHWDMSYNGLSLKYSTSITWSLSKGAVRDVSIAIPDDFDALYNQMLAETDSAKLESEYQALNKMAIDKYCMVVPVTSLQGFCVYAARAKDIGYGVREAIEYCPERFWVSK